MTNKEKLYMLSKFITKNNTSITLCLNLLIQNFLASKSKNGILINLYLFASGKHSKQ